MEHTTALIDIVTPFIGREFCFARYAEKFWQLQLPATRCHLLFYDLSQDNPAFSVRVMELMHSLRERFAEVRYVKACHPIVADIREFGGQEGRHARIAETYNHVKRYLDGDLMFMVEDDVGVPPDSLIKLLHLFADPRVGAACGHLNPRWPADRENWYPNKPLAWHVERVQTFPGEPEWSYSVRNLEPRPDGVEEIGAGTWGCFLTRQYLYKAVPLKGFNRGTTGPDIDYGISIAERGFKFMLDWSIKCEHYHENAAGKLEVY